MRLIVFLLTVLLFPLPASAVTRVLGAAVLGPSELLGLCVAPKILNLVDAGALATGIDGSTRSGFKAGGYENVGVGTGYLVASNATISRLVTYTLAGSAPVLLTNDVIATANVPDLNTGFVPNAYNPARGALGQFIIPGTRNNGPCPATLCPHFRTYNGNTNAVDVTLTSIAVGSNVFDILTSQDGNAVWTIIPSQVAGFILTQYSSGFVEGLSLTSSAGSSMHSLATDGAFVYTILNSSGIEFLRRVRLSTFVSEDVNIFGGTISQILLQKDGFLYVGQTGSLQKVRLSDRTIVATLSLQGVETPLIAGSEYDVVNNRFYVTSTTSGTSMTVRRVNLDSFVSEQFINIVLTPSNYSTGYDFAHQAMYESNAGVNVALQKVTLCS